MGGFKSNVHWYTVGWLRAIYDWMLRWARTKYGEQVLFVVAVAESSFFPLPPDAVLLCLGVARPKRSLWYALLATVGSVLGGLLGYLIGAVFFASVGEWILDALSLHEAFALAGSYFSENAFLAIVGAAFTPIPYKVFTIAAGVWAINPVVFLAASVVGRGARFFAEGLFLYYGGPRIAVFIDRWFGWVTLGVFLVVVALVAAVRFLG